MTANTQQPQRQYLKDYTAPAFQIENVQLYFNLHETATRVKSKIQFKKSAQQPLVLNGENLKLISIAINDKKLDSSQYTLTDEHLTIEQTPDQFELQVEVEINPEANKSCEGLYLSQGIFCTQCEAESFRKITYFMDRPDVMTKYTVEIEADEKKYPVLMSNGDCIDKKSLGGGRHYTKWIDPFKKPSYLFALVAGDLGVVKDHFITQSGKKVDLYVYASHGKQDRCHFAMESLKKSMKWDEERFGLEYDLSQYMIVSIDDFNMGAMENKGLNVFNSRLVLADDKTATDNDFHSIESVVGHEYFHNWTGNRVTCRNWFELSLKEGLTVFRDQEFSADMNSAPVQRITDVDRLRARQFSEDAGPNSHPVRPESCLAVDNFYTATIYEKGAEVIRMMQTIVGRDGFRKGMDEYFKRHDGQAVTIENFAAAISEPNGQDFTQFKLWYSQAGTPIVTVQENFSNDGTYTVKLTQSNADLDNQKNNQPFYIPLKFGLITNEGQEIEKGLWILKEKTQTWTFKNLKAKPTLSLNREFSAPIKLKWSMPHSEMLNLIKFDTDSFNKREACQKMLLDECLRLITALDAGQNVTVKTEIIEALGHLLKDNSLDPEFKSLILSLPMDLVLAQEVTVLNPVSLAQCKKMIVKEFANQFKTAMIQIYQAHHAKNTRGDRALKNLVLGLLCSAQTTEGHDLADKQYFSATNMTDSIYALIALGHFNSASQQKANSDFYNKWKSDSVVFNKWLNVQASSQHEKTFERVQHSMTVQGFDSNTPNNIYNLHGVFGNNFLRFHTTEQNTYQWYCAELLRIDSVNPQVAARMAQAFNFTKKLPAALKQAAQTEISKLLNNPKLSKNARELLEKCL